MKVLILYHGNCIDGFTAAWVAHRYFFIPANVYEMECFYTPESTAKVIEHIATNEYEQIYILDFSYKLPDLRRLVYEARFKVPTSRIVLMDHHKTAFEEYLPHMKVEPDSHWSGILEDIGIILDNSKSGALLAWDYFFQGQEAPWLVRYVSDHDLWKVEYVDTKVIIKYIAAQRRHFGAWSYVAQALEDSVVRDSVIREGKKLLAEHNRVCKANASKAYPVEIDGISGLATECEWEHISDTGHILASTCNTFGLLIDWSNAIDGKITLSLRGSDSCDVSAIAKKYGGGGHKGAAGFTIPIIQLSTIIKGYQER